jgi:hypothetical protein
MQIKKTKINWFTSPLSEGEWTSFKFQLTLFPVSLGQETGPAKIRALLATFTMLDSYLA